MPDDQNGIGRADLVRDGRRHRVEGVPVQRLRAPVTGQVGDQPPTRPPTGQQALHTVPDVAGRTQTVNQEQRRCAGSTANRAQDMTHAHD